MEGHKSSEKKSIFIHFQYNDSSALNIVFFLLCMTYQVWFTVHREIASNDFESRTVLFQGWFPPHTHTWLEKLFYHVIWLTTGNWLYSILFKITKTVTTGIWTWYTYSTFRADNRYTNRISLRLLMTKMTSSDILIF